eukprot:1257917-Amphidinium_carterae.1
MATLHHAPHEISSRRLHGPLQLLDHVRIAPIIALPIAPSTSHADSGKCILRLRARAFMVTATLCTTWKWGRRVSERKTLACRGTLRNMLSKVDNSLVRDLNPEEQIPPVPTTQSRAMTSGHYVLTQPEPLPDPALVASSP